MIFNKVFQGSVSCHDDVVKLINKYSEEIDKSEELTEEQKLSVKNGLATALYSFNYWKNQSSKK